MKKICISPSKYAMVDEQDFEWLDKFSWVYTNGYASTSINGKTNYMHRLIMSTPDGMYTDHINHDKLDNRRSNLRVVTQKQNLANARKPVNNTSGYKGVHFFKKANKYQASIYHKGKHLHLGLYMTAKEAARVYDDKAKEIRGEFALVNGV